MTGLERNSDIVFAAAYAPLLQVSLDTYCKDRVTKFITSSSMSTRLNGCVMDMSVVTWGFLTNLSPSQSPDLISFECAPPTRAPSAIQN